MTGWRGDGVTTFERKLQNVEGYSLNVNEALEGDVRVTLLSIPV